MRRIVIGTMALLLLAAPVRGAEAPDEDAHALVKRVIDSAPDVPYVSHMQLTTPGGLVREFTLDGKTLENGIDSRYLEVTGPFNLKDTRYLFYDHTERRDDQYMYLPFMKRVVRMSEKTRREPFLGSTFFVDDLLKHPIEDFTYRFVGAATVGQRTCRLVEATPKQPARETYGKSVFAIDPADLVVMRAELYDHDGKLFKIHHVDTIEKIDTYWTPMLQTMENVPDHESSQLKTIDIQYNAPIGDEIFREAYLGR
jgi:Outer membrane lipoprotein-sorting protein